MDKTLQYTQVMSNFDSAYNISPNLGSQRTMYIPMYSSATFSTFSNRPTSPLFHRNKSPPPRPPILTGSGVKFNFDLYKMDENNNEYDDYSSPSYRSISPSSSRLIHHYPLSSSTSKSPTLSKLQQINNELCHTLARSELTDRSPPSPPHYHIHHYPLSQQSHRKYRSRSTSEEYSPSSKLKVSPKIHKARVTYKVHIPRRHRQEHQHHYRKSARHMSASDVYSSDDPMIVDLYPTRDQGFVKQTKKYSDHQSPWVVDGTAVRRSSYSDTNTSRPPQTPKGPHYGDKPIKSYRRSTSDKENPSSDSRHQSPYVTSRIRRESPSSRTREPVWHPTSKTISKKPPKYFAPTLQTEYDVSTEQHIIDGTESEPVSERKTLSDRTKIRNGDPKLRKRIANAESKVKSAWEPTITGLTHSTVNESKSPIPSPVKKTTTSTPPKSKIKSAPSEPTTPTKEVIVAPPPPTNTNIDRGSLNDVLRKPMFESTPRSQNIVAKNDDSAADLSENESQTSEQSKKQKLPRPLLPIEKTPTVQEQPKKPSTELPKTIVPESKPTVKDGVLIRENDVKHNQNPTALPTSEITNNNDEVSDASNKQSKPTPPKIPTPQQKTSPPPPKPNNQIDGSVVDEDEDENDEEVARSFDFHKWISDASKAISAPSKKDDIVIPSTPPQPPPKSNIKSPPRRIEQPPSPPPDENLYKPPFGPKKKDEKSSIPPPPPPPAKTTTGETDDVDDFFN